MSEIMSGAAYEEVRKAHVGPEGSEADMDAFDALYDEYAMAHGDEAARKLLFDELKASNPDVYISVMESLASKMSNETHDALKEVASRAQKFQAESGPEQERTTF